AVLRAVHIQRCSRSASSINRTPCDTIFFFSSRRRHTRSKRDWSSDVCSSDLFAVAAVQQNRLAAPQKRVAPPLLAALDALQQIGDRKSVRVGKECRSRWAADH